MGSAVLSGMSGGVIVGSKQLYGDYERISKELILTDDQGQKWLSMFYEQL
jgi:hypothetical protein